MCDEGRFGWKYIHSDARLVAPRLGRMTTSSPAAGHVGGQNGNGHASLAVSTDSSVSVAEQLPADLAEIDPWPEALDATRRAIVESMGKDGSKFVAIFSPMMTVEEAYMLAKYLRSGSAKPVLAMGPVPVVGEDDRYPKNHKGEAPAPDKTKFTIRAEKCPNRRGVELVLKHFQGELISFDKTLERLERGEFSGAYVVGGYVYPGTSYCERSTAALSKLSTLIVQDILRSPLTDAATILLAGGSFAEREGTFINHAGLAQLIRPVLRSLGDTRSDGRMLFELSGRKGVYNSAAIRRELATEIFSLAALASGELGAQGTFITKQPQPVMA